MLDVTKLIATVGTHPGVRKAVRSLRHASVSHALVAVGLVPKLGAVVIPGVFAAGAMFGAAAALVMTPRTREALREDVRRMLEQLRAGAAEESTESATATS